MIRLYALTGTVTGSPLLAQAATDGGGLGLDTLVQTGVTGTLAAVLMVFARTAYARETARADRLEEKLDELNRTVLERYAGALAEAARAVADATTTLSRVR
ncbi:hypothetical protein MXD62_19915 [Frankia sp. Mgl5]|uniref:hypothetical protein n=1 Tax=Frankia sp. Mgl5 TaxID=2933793 RepID=UPI0020103189|nr:hypothetical protein [Frankia sp. Mgl5]MCK9929418.1 hypothetical protein [Frankia sp. Mgl5]